MTSLNSNSSSIPSNGQAPAANANGGNTAATANGSQNTANSNATQFYRLKVEDALSYLDQVKFQFERQPEVYNQFLDIMKEFKSQTIDTPGVISRVSNLFRGHTDLIEGFNTFLPPGYKIEVQENDAVHYTAPNSNMSTLVQPINNAKVGTVKADAKLDHVSVKANSQTSVVTNNQGSMKINQINQATASSTNLNRVTNTPTPPPSSVASSTSSTSSSSSSSLQQQQQQQQAASHLVAQQLQSNSQVTNPQSQVEFGHAINYVNKIKSRFHNQPDIYKSFLEILHTYQKQQKNLKEGFPTNNQNFLSETEVYAKVAKLFKNQEDLLIEFSQFLPDANNSGGAANTAAMLGGAGLNNNANSTNNFANLTINPQLVHQIQQQNTTMSLNDFGSLSGAQPGYAVALNPINVQQMPAHLIQQTNLMNIPTIQAINVAPTLQQASTAIPSQLTATIPTPTQNNVNKSNSPKQASNKLNSTNLSQSQTTPNSKQQNYSQNQNFAPKQEQQIPPPQQQQQQQSRPLTPVNQRNFTATNSNNMNIINNNLPVKRTTTSSLSNQQQPVPAKKQKVLTSSKSNAAGNQILESQSGASSSSSTTRLNENTKPSSINKQSSAYKAAVAAASANVITEVNFFEKIKKALRTQQVYENFLKCLALFNQGIVTRSELITLVEPFLGKFANLYRWFKDYVENKPMNGSGYDGLSQQDENMESGGRTSVGINGGVTGGRDRIVLPHGENIPLEIDYVSCKQYGASYRDISSYPQPISSGQTDLCKQVLNATYVSFPSWSEDSTFISSKKNQYEETIFRVEDDRFELDLVLETNANTIRVLENIMTKISQMSSDELSKFRLDNKLGSNSETIHIKAIQRIYGDKSKDFIDGLKRNPNVAVPLVLKRLKAKEEEWREAKKNLEKQWRETIEKNYLKSLDYCAVPFKQNDQKHLKTKSLINEIEAIYLERQEEAKGNEETGANSAANQTTSQNTINHNQPHLIFKYEDRSILEDAAALIIHHVKRQTTIQKEDKQKIKQIIYHFLSDLFFVSRGALSDDESSPDPPSANLLPPPPPPPLAPTTPVSTKEEPQQEAKKLRSNQQQQAQSISQSAPPPPTPTLTTQISQSSTTSSTSLQTPTRTHTDTNKRRLTDAEFDRCGSMPNEYKNPEDMYRLFYVDEHWYLFFRYHQILCERLFKIYKYSLQLAEQESNDMKNREQPVAEALKLRNKSEVAADEYYPTFLDIVRNLLDGNMDSTQYEDALREMFGINAYIAFTLDKVVHNCVRQLQYLVQDETSTTIKQYYCDEHHRPHSSSSNAAGVNGGAALTVGASNTSTHSNVSGCGGKVSNMSYASVMNAEMNYQKKVELLLNGDNCYKIIFYKNTCRLTMEVIETQNNDEDEEDEEAEEVEVEKWSEYIEKYATENKLDEQIKSALLKRIVFLPKSAHYLKQKFNINSTSDPVSNSKKSNENSDKAKSAASITTVTEIKKESEEQPQKSDEPSKTPPPPATSITSKKQRDKEPINNYRRNSLKNSKKCHHTVTKKMYDRYRKHINKWLKEHQKLTNETIDNWLLGNGGAEVENSKYKTVCIKESSVKKAPYHVYYRYKVQPIGESSTTTAPASSSQSTTTK